MSVIIFLKLMVEEIQKNTLEKHLGEQIEVIEGKRVEFEIGILSYEHNTGRLAMYSDKGEFIQFLRGGEVIRFITNPNLCYSLSCISSQTLPEAQLKYLFFSISLLNQLQYGRFSLKH